MKTKIFISLFLIATCFTFSCKNKENKNYDENTIKELIAAINEQNIPLIEKYLKRHPNLLEVKIDNDQNSLLHYAIRKDKYESFCCLLKLGADPNCVNIRNVTPLLLTTMIKSLETGSSYDIKYMTALLDYNADASIELKRIGTEFENYDNQNLAREEEMYMSGTTPLIASAMLDDIEKTKLLVEKGNASLTQKDGRGANAALNAIFFNNIETAYYLILEKYSEIPEYFYRWNYLNDENFYKECTIDLLDGLYPTDETEINMKEEIVEYYISKCK